MNYNVCLSITFNVSRFCSIDRTTFYFFSFIMLLKTKLKKNNTNQIINKVEQGN